MIFSSLLLSLEDASISCWDNGFLCYLEFNSRIITLGDLIFRSISVLILDDLGWPSKLHVVEGLCVLANNFVSKLSKQIIVNFIDFTQLVYMIDIHVGIMVNIFAHYKHMRTREVKFLEFLIVASPFIKFNYKFFS